MQNSKRKINKTHLTKFKLSIFFFISPLVNRKIFKDIWVFSTDGHYGLIVGAFHLGKKPGNFGVNFRELLYGKKLFYFAANFACVEARVA